MIKLMGWFLQSKVLKTVTFLFLSLLLFSHWLKPATILWAALWRGPTSEQMSHFLPISCGELRTPSSIIHWGPHSANEQWAWKWSLSGLPFWLQTWERPEPKELLIAKPHPDFSHQKLRENKYLCFFSH